MTYCIRPIQPEDNAAVAALVQSVLEEHNCIGPGFASSDPELQDMYSAYQRNLQTLSSAYTGSKAGYWVIEETETGRVLGGAGYSRLKGTTPEESICELQKVYFYPELRGKGMGRALVTYVIRQAAADGYREMYLETVPQMASAQGLYRKLGFTSLQTNKGNTGHQKRCTVYMSRELAPMAAAV